MASLLHMLSAAGVCGTLLTPAPAETARPPETVRRALERMPDLEGPAYTVARGAIVRSGRDVVPWLEERARDEGRIGECARECLLRITGPAAVEAWDRALKSHENVPSDLPAPYLAGLQEQHAGAGQPYAVERVTLALSGSADPAAAAALARNLDHLRLSGTDALRSLGDRALPALRATVVHGVAWLEQGRAAFEQAERARLVAAGWQGEELDRRLKRVSWGLHLAAQMRTGYAALLLGELGDREAIPFLRRLLEMEELPGTYGGAAFALADRDERLVPIGRTWLKHEREAGGDDDLGLRLLLAQHDPSERSAALRELLDDEDPTIRGAAAAHHERTIWLDLPTEDRASAIEGLLGLLADTTSAFADEDGNTIEVRDAAWFGLAALLELDDEDGPDLGEGERHRILAALADTLADGRVRGDYHRGAPTIFAGSTDVAVAEQILAGYRRSAEPLLGVTLAMMPYGPALPDLAKHLDQAFILSVLHFLGEPALPHLRDVLTGRLPGAWRRHELALEGLGKLGAAAAPAWDEVVACLPDEPAAAALLAIDRPRAVRLLEAIVVDPRTTREQAQRLSRLILATP